MERRLKAVGERCPKLETMSKREEGRDVSKLVERVGEEVVPMLMKDDNEGLVVCHGDLWSGNYMKGRVERVWGGMDGSGRRRGIDSGEVIDREGQEDGEDGNGKNRSNAHRETITGEFIFDAAVRKIFP